MKPAELLNAGADNIEKHGWLQGDFGDPGYGFCALGSMREILGASYVDKEGTLNKQHREYPKAKRALKQVMVDQLEPTINLRTPFVIAVINDKVDRTQDEIVSCMRKAANNLEA